MICKEAVEIENNYLIQEALEAFPNLIIVDNKGIIVYINRKYLKLLGIDKNDVIGKHVTEIIPNTRMHIITKEGIEEIGSIMTFLNPSSCSPFVQTCIFSLLIIQSIINPLL